MPSHDPTLGRRRALADLDQAIERVERERLRRLEALGRMEAAGLDASGVRTLLRAAEDHLASLREGRAALAAGRGLGPGEARSGPLTATARRPR